MLGIWFCDRTRVEGFAGWAYCVRSILRAMKRRHTINTRKLGVATLVAVWVKFLLCEHVAAALQQALSVPSHLNVTPKSVTDLALERNHGGRVVVVHLFGTSREEDQELLIGIGVWDSTINKSIQFVDRLWVRRAATAKPRKQIVVVQRSSDNDERSSSQIGKERGILY
jgi:hypothetical protein